MTVPIMNLNGILIFLSMFILFWILIVFKHEFSSTMVWFKMKSYCIIEYFWSLKHLSYKIYWTPKFSRQLMLLLSMQIWILFERLVDAPMGQGLLWQWVILIFLLKIFHKIQKMIGKYLCFGCILIKAGRFSIFLEKF